MWSISSACNRQPSTPTASPTPTSIPSSRADKPVIFNFHGYPLLIHRLTYRRHNHDNFHVRGYKEKGSINTPLELAILNNVDRFNLAIDIIDRVPRLRNIGAHTQDWLRDQITESLNYANTWGVDKPEIRNWTLPQ